MSEQTSTEAHPQAGGTVGEPVRDAIERKKLLKQAISAGDAAVPRGGPVCGSSVFAARLAPSPLRT